MPVKIFTFISALISLSLLLSCRKDDTTPPIVSLEGEAYIILALGDSFSDPGATASDEVDGVLNVQLSGNVNTAFAGTYFLRYSATDASGNTGEAVRTVVVGNASSVLSGNYAAHILSPDDTLVYTSVFSPSTLINNRLWMAGFGLLNDAAVYADMSDTLLIVPTQNVQSGNPPELHRISGNGHYNPASDTLRIFFSFNDSSASGIVNGSAIYKRLP